MNPTTDTGATEFLANLSIGAIVTAALTLTVLRLLILQISGALKNRGYIADGSGPSPTLTAKMGVPATGPGDSWARGLAEILESLIIAGVLVFLVIRPFFVQAFFIPSESMENTLLGHDAGRSASGRPEDTHNDSVHDHIFVNKLVYRYSHPQRGDIIVFKAPKKADGDHRFDPEHQVENVLIKRLIGVPGDTIEVKDGRVYRNGQPLDEYHNDKSGSLQSGFAYSIKEPMDQNLEPNFVFGTVGSRGDADTPGGPQHLGPHQFWVMGDNRNDSNDSRYWGPLDDARVIGKASIIFWPPSRIRMLH